MYLFQKIEEMTMQYSDARKTIAEFILNEKGHLYRYTMDEITQYTYTSKSTLVRFAQTLGYSGWRDFMKAIVEEVKYQEQNPSTIDVNYPFSEKDSTKEIIEHVSRLQVESILDTMSLLDEKMIELAVDILLQTKRIVILGMKPNVYTAESLRWKFLTIGKHVDVCDQGELGMNVRTLTDRDCAIILSYSGDNVFQDPMCHIETLKKQGVKLIGITSGGKNYIRGNIACVLSISSRERLYSKIATFATEQSMLTIFDILFACYFKKDYHKNLIYKIENSKILEEQRKASLKIMQEKDDNFILFHEKSEK